MYSFVQTFPLKAILMAATSAFCFTLIYSAQAQTGTTSPPPGAYSRSMPVQSQGATPPRSSKFQTISVRGGLNNPDSYISQGVQPSVQASTYDVLPFYQNPTSPTPSPYAYGPPLFPYYGSASPYYPGYDYSPYMPSMSNPMSHMPQPIPPQMSFPMGPNMVMSPMQMPANPRMQQPPMMGGYLWNGAQGQAVPADPLMAELEGWRNLSRNPFYVTIQGREALVEWGGAFYKVPIGQDNRIQLYVPQPK